MEVIQAPLNDDMAPHVIIQVGKNNFHVIIQIRFFFKCELKKKIITWEWALRDDLFLMAEGEVLNVMFPIVL